MGKSIAWSAVLLTGVLAGCVAPPPLPPLVATPGPGKTDDAFRQDDAACRTVAAAPPAQPASTAPATAPAQANATPPTTGAAPAAGLPPGAAYLRCMTARQNVVRSLAPAVPLYVYYQPYPIYAGVGFGHPFFHGYGYPFGFGYGGRYFGHYGRYGGFRGHGGYRGFGGHR